MAGPDAPRISFLSFLIREAGPEALGVLVLGLGLIMWGLINLGFVRNRSLLGAQALLSFLPLGFVFATLCKDLSSFMDRASAPGPTPTPEVFAGMVVHPIIHGLLGVVFTGIPAIIGIIALARNPSPPKHSERRE